MSNGCGINNFVIPSTINMFRGRQRLVMTRIVPHAGPSPFDNIDKCFDTTGMGIIQLSRKLSVRHRLHAQDLITILEGAHHEFFALPYKFLLSV